MIDLVERFKPEAAFAVNRHRGDRAIPKRKGRQRLGQFHQTAKRVDQQAAVGDDDYRRVSVRGDLTHRSSAAVGQLTPALAAGDGEILLAAAPPGQNLGKLDFKSVRSRS